MGVATNIAPKNSQKFLKNRLNEGPKNRKNRNFKIFSNALKTDWIPLNKFPAVYPPNFSQLGLQKPPLEAMEKSPESWGTQSWRGRINAGGLAVVEPKNQKYIHSDTELYF